MPLKYGVRIRFASCCISVVIPLDIFNILSMLFFSKRDTLSALAGSEINSVIFHDAIMMLLICSIMMLLICCSFSWRCAALLSFMTLATPVTLSTNDPRMLSSGRTGRMPHIIIGRILLLFFFFFFFFFFVFKLIPIFVLAFIAPHCDCGSLSESRIIRDNAFLSLLDEYIVSHVSFSEIIAANMLSWLRHAASNELIPRSPLANRFSNHVPGPQNWYPEICNSIDSVFIARFNKSLDGICCNSLPKAPKAVNTHLMNRQIVIQALTVPPNLLVYVLVIYLLWDLCNFSNSRSSTIFEMHSGSFEGKLCRSSDMTRNILITEWFHFMQFYKCYYFKYY